MSRRLRILATIILVLFAVIVAQSANIQFFRAPVAQRQSQQSPQPEPVGQLPARRDPRRQRRRAGVLGRNRTIPYYPVSARLSRRLVDLGRRRLLLAATTAWGDRRGVQQLPGGAPAAAAELRTTARADERRRLGDPDARAGAATRRASGDEGDRRRGRGARPQDRRRARHVLQSELQPGAADLAESYDVATAARHLYLKPDGNGFAAARIRGDASRRSRRVRPSRSSRPRPRS